MAKAVQLRANPTALASISSSLSARILIMPVPSMCCAKHADNPLIHKPTQCHAISSTVDGGGGKNECHFTATCFYKTAFPFPGYDTFLFSPHFPPFCELSFCPPSLLLFSTGATVLVVNATDLDASREFGQASLIYSLEGSSQFRLNSRSGVCMCILKVYMEWIFQTYSYRQSIEKELSQALLSIGGSCF